MYFGSFLDGYCVVIGELVVSLLLRAGHQHRDISDEAPETDRMV
jgi:hypothetical protein